MRVGLPKRLMSSEDYFEWATSMQNVLSCKNANLWFIIEGRLVKPEEHLGEGDLKEVKLGNKFPTKDIAEYYRADVEARSILLNSLGPAQQALVDTSTTARKVWEKLRENYAQNVAQQIASLEAQLANLYQGDDKINVYSYKLETICRKLDHVDAPVSGLRKLRTFLRGLGPQHDVWRKIFYFNTRLFFQKEGDSDETANKKALEDYEIAVSTIMAEEAEQKSFRRQYPARAMQAQSQPVKKGKDKFCTNCKRDNHNLEDCFMEGGPKHKDRTEKQKQKKTKKVTGNLAQVDSDEMNLCLHVSTPDDNVAPQNETWIIDSGASRHMTGDKTLFSTYGPSPVQEVFVADNRGVPVAGMGNVRLVMSNSKGSRKSITLQDVLHVPGLGNNLFSTPQVQRLGGSINFTKKTVEIFDKKGRLALRGKRRGDVNYLLVEGTTTAVAKLVTSEKALDQAKLWHQRLGHLHMQATLKTASLTDGMNLKAMSGPSVGNNCETCIKSKHRHAPIKSRGPKTTRPLELVHMDLAGPLPEGLSKEKYYLLMVDDCTRYCFGAALIYKSSAFQAFRTIDRWTQTQLGKRICRVRTDNGGEFLSREFSNYLNHRGIGREVTPRFTPQSNGLVERTNQIVKDYIRCMLEEANLTTQYWPFAFSHGLKLRNMSATSTDSSKTPHEGMHGKRQDLQGLRVFGCKAWARVPDELRKSLDPKSVECIHLGHVSNNHPYIYRLMDVETGQIFTSRHVIFRENERIRRKSEAPFEELSDDETGTTGNNLPRPGLPAPVRSSLNIPRTSPSSEEPSQPVGATNYPHLASIEEAQLADTTESGDSLESPTQQLVPSAESTDDEFHEPINLIPSRRRPQDIRGRDSPSRHQEIDDESDDSLALLPTPHQTVGGDTTTVGDTRTVGDKNNANESTGDESRYNLRARPHRLGDYARHVTTNLSKPPATLKQARMRADWPLWEGAIQAELKSHESNKTWTLVDHPQNKATNVVSCKWVFAIKKKADGSLDKYKARLVARGFTQRYGYDYDETFSPVVKATTLRILIGLAAAFDWKIVHWDAVTAFLNGRLSAEVYMTMPPGHEVPGKVCFLNKAIYGLKQAGREWYLFATKVLEQLGFTKLQEDHCLFHSKKAGRQILLALYVDDLVAASPKASELAWLHTEIQTHFKITDQGDLSSVLNVSVSKSTNSTSLGQPGYIQKILDRFQMLEAKPAFTPLPATGIAHPENPEHCSVADKELFQQLVGSVNYLACYTRPDVAYAVQALSRYLAQPTIHALSAGKHLLRYLKTTQDYRLRFPKLASGRNLTLEVFTDADFANQKAIYSPNQELTTKNKIVIPVDTTNTPRKSVTGMIFLMNGSPISWLSKQQPIIATSTQMAEYIAAAEGAKEALWIRSLFHSLQLRGKEAIPHYIDNQAAIQLCKNPVLHKATKHIDIIYHKIRELAAVGVINIEYTESGEQRADALTKTLNRQQIEKFCKEIGLKDRSNEKSSQ